MGALANNVMNSTNGKSTRREFMATTGGFALGDALSPGLMGAIQAHGTKSMKILILGGTGFIGPHIVNRAVANGHTVTLFNRGKSAPELFPDLAHLEGDRYTDLSSLANAVSDGRQWDAVIDPFAYVPRTVTDAMDVLKPAMGQYVVISTISVYAAMNQIGMEETAPVAHMDDAVAKAITDHTQARAHYGPMKARVERAAEERFPGRVSVIRPGLIVGPRDTTGRHTYWPVRASEGGPMLAPGTGDDLVQIVDARDLADFTIHCCEQKHMGIYNAVSPAGERTMRDVINSAVRVAAPKGKTAEGGDAAGLEKTEPVWVDADFLESQGIEAWQHMPAWIPASTEGYAGIGQMSTAKSIAAGLKTRSLDDTNRDTLEYVAAEQARVRAQKGDEAADKWATRVRGGITREREAEVLKAWDEREG
ncbi:MAG: 2'-hydroxyisoflavone reductase [Phycisphaerales bacterium]